MAVHSPRDPSRPGIAGPPGTWVVPHEAAGGPARASSTARGSRAHHQPDGVADTSPPQQQQHADFDAFTSLTIGSIPVSIRRTELCAVLDETRFAGRYDYLYVPCNHDKTNFGQAFINLRSHQDAQDFLATWQGSRIVGGDGQVAVLSVAVSQVQGFHASVQPWTIAKFISLKDPDFRPFIADVNTC